MSKTWRDYVKAHPSSELDQVKVHPAADLFPMMSDEEIDELAADMAKNGLQQPIIWFRDQVLDGRNRVAALCRIHDLERRDDIEREIQLGKKSIIYPFLDDPTGYVVSANLHRRHLTAEQKREVIAQLLKGNPGRSDRATATIAKVDNKTVAAVRADLQRREELPHVSTRTDTKGRQQPARKSKQRALIIDEPETEKPRALQRDQAIVDFAALLHRKLPETLDDLVRLLGHERVQIAALPMHKRLVLARGYLRAMGVTLEHLQPVEDRTADDQNPARVH